MELKELQNMNYDELVQLHQSGEIDTLQFVMANGEMAEMFENSCTFYNLNPTEEIARQWLDNHSNTLDSSLTDVLELTEGEF